MIGRVVVVTGGSRGIGRALVRACLERGAQVVSVARTAEAEPGALAVAADITRAEDVARLVAAALAAYGQIDVLVNNAGITGDDLAAVMAVNAGGALACARAVLAVNPAARVVGVSSGIVGAPRAGAAVYAASKHALEGLTRALACDAPMATVTAVQLGGHRTEMAASVYTGDELAALPPPEDAVAALVHAMTAPAAEVHGRITAPWRGEPRPLDLAGADALAHPLGPSPRARAALAAWAQTGALATYPPVGASPLGKLLAAEHRVPLDAIVLGAGASELIDRALGVLLRAGERLVANAPSWPLFPHLCRARALTAVTVPYQLRDGRADHDLEACAAAVARDRGVRVVYLISPANPTGAALDDAPFARFVAALPAHITVIVDEAYAEFATRADALRAPMHARRGAPVIAIRTFSKFYGLAGLRIGYAVAPPPLARALAAAAPPFGVTLGAQLAAAAALGDREHAARTLARVASARARLPADHLASDAPFALAAVPGVPRYFAGRYAMVPLWATDATEPTRET